MPIVKIDDARTFVAVTETRSVSQAARELHLTQPAVTRRIQRLEHAMGAPLIDRRRRPFALTDIGRAALDHFRRLLSTAHELSALAQGGLLPSRELRLGVAHALTEDALTEPVDEMRRAFPTAVWRLYTGWSRDLLTRVKTGALDAAVVLLPDDQSVPNGLDATALAKDHLAIVAPRRWRARYRVLRDLVDAEWILNPEGCAARLELQRALARARLPLRVSVETYNYELQMSLVARGRGLGLVPQRLVARSPSRARLTTLRLASLEFPFTIWMATGQLAHPLELPLDALRLALAARLSVRPRRGR
jgi:DNA-binding transcriptional LysR family regulator